MERQVSDGLRDLILAMLTKSPDSRINMDGLKQFSWLNEGYAASLADRGADMLANLSDQELKAQGISRADIEIAKEIVSNLQA